MSKKSISRKIFIQFIKNKLNTNLFPCRNVSEKQIKTKNNHKEIIWRAIFNISFLREFRIKRTSGRNKSMPLTWKVENKKLYLIRDGLNPEYEYSLSKSELTLKTLFIGTTMMATFKKAMNDVKI